jgi:transcription elongation factor Elf1
MAKNRIPLNRLYHCPGCGAEGVVKLDKHKHPYWCCSICGLRMFIKSATCEFGFLVLQKWLSVTHDRFRHAVLIAEAKERKAYIAKQQRTPAEAEM